MKKTKKKKPSPTKNKAGKEINLKKETNIKFSYSKKITKGKNYKEKNKQNNSNIIFEAISFLLKWIKNF